MPERKSIKPSRTIVAKARKVLALAQQRAKQVNNQMEMRNALYTPKGIVSLAFTTEEERIAYFKTKEAEEVRKLIRSLPEPPLSDEVIVIRIPRDEKNGKPRRR